MSCIDMRELFECSIGISFLSSESSLESLLLKPTFWFSKPVGHCILSYKTTCKFRALAGIQRFAKPEISLPDLGLAIFFAVRLSINSNYFIMAAISRVWQTISSLSGDIKALKHGFQLHHQGRSSRNRCPVLPSAECIPCPAICWMI